MSILEVIAVFTAALGVILTAREKIIGWFFALFAALCYFWIFFQQKLYADMVLQLIFAGCSVQGWILWSGRGSGEIKTPSVNYRRLLKHGFYALLLNSVLYYILRFWSQDPAPFWDSTLSCGSIVAQYWTALRYRVSWLLWALIDCAYVVLFYERHLYLTMMLYLCFVVISFYGYYQWKASFNKGD